jgi:M6 family metalloprotease-like protein
VKFTNAAASFNNMLNQSGYSANRAQGSAKDYFRDNSGGLFIPTFDVIGPVALPQNMAYYGANTGDDDSDAHPREMAVDAVNAAEALGVDFAQYAKQYSNGKFIRQIFIFYAGRGEADGGSADTVWPHAWSFPSGSKIDGVNLYGYACTSELSRYQEAQSGVYMTSIGTVCHEFTHTLELPDFYDTDYADNGYSIGLDAISLMSSGNYNYDGILPAGLTSFERWMAGWIPAPTILTAGQVTLTPLTSSNTAATACALTTDRHDELYFFENRSKSYKWDSKLGGSNCYGMLVYHYDKSANTVAGSGKTAAALWDENIINCYPSHECMSVLSAKPNGKAQYTSPNNAVDAGIFFFPNYGAATLCPNTNPQLVSWSGQGLGYKLTDITRQTNGNITFNLVQNGDIPQVQVKNSTIDLDQSYAVGTTVDLSVRTVNNVSSVAWSVNGNAVSSGSIRFSSAGEYVVRAVCAYADGTREILVKHIKVTQ